MKFQEPSGTEDPPVAWVHGFFPKWGPEKQEGDMRETGGFYKQVTSTRFRRKVTRVLWEAPASAVEVEEEAGVAQERRCTLC